MKDEKLKALKDLLSKCEEAEYETAELEREIKGRFGEEASPILYYAKEPIKT